MSLNNLGRNYIRLTIFTSCSVAMWKKWTVIRAFESEPRAGLIMAAETYYTWGAMMALDGRLSKLLSKSFHFILICLVSYSSLQIEYFTRDGL